MSKKCAFLKACKKGELENVRSLLDKVDYVDVRTEQGWTGLILACHGGHHEVAKFLVAKGADVNATNSKGTTVFMYAKSPIVKTGDTKFLDYLISNGANPNAKDIHGKTALDYVKELHPDNILVEYLARLKCGM